MRRSTTTLASPHRPAFPSTRRTPRASAASVLHQALPHLAASKPAQSFDRPGSSCAVPTPSERLRPPGKLPPYTATRAVSRPPQAAPCTALQTTHSAPVSTKSAAPATPPPSASRSALLAASVPSIAHRQIPRILRCVAGHRFLLLWRWWSSLSNLTTTRRNREEARQRPHGSPPWAAHPKVPSSSAHQHVHSGISIITFFVEGALSRSRTYRSFCAAHVALIAFTRSGYCVTKFFSSQR